MSSLRGAQLLALLWGLAGCFQAPVATTGVGGCDSCRAGGSTGTLRGGSTAARGSSSGGASGGGSTLSRGSTAGGSTGSAGSGGSSTSGGTATSGGLVDAGCPSSYFPLDARIYDLSSNSPIAGAGISALDQNAVPIVDTGTTSRADGTFTLCLPAGVEATPEIQAGGYPTTYLSNFNLSGPLTQFAGNDGVPMLSSDLLSAFAAIVSVGAVSTQAVIMAGVASLSRQPPCVGNASGWVLGLDLPDGGLLPDGGEVPSQLEYVASNGFPMAGLTSTSGYGLALFFNVDTTLTNVVSVEATNPDAGPCPVDIAPEMMTGRIYVAGGALSIMLLPTP